MTSRNASVRLNVRTGRWTKGRRYARWYRGAHKAMEHAEDKACTRNGAGLENLPERDRSERLTDDIAVESTAQKLYYARFKLSGTSRWNRRTSPR